MQLRELDANLLVVLDALLQVSSVTKAANHLGRSPSAISHSLSNLRHLFDDELFVRAGQKLVPTARAQGLAESVHEVVQGMEQLLSPPQKFDPALEKRCFSFAASDACELTVLHCLRENLKGKAPGIGIRWNALHPRLAFDNLRSGAVQFILADGQPDGSAADFIWKHMFDETFVTLARPGHPLSSRNITIEQFSAAEHVMIRGDEDGLNPLETHFGEQGIEPNIAVQASSVFAGLFLALDSYYLISVPRNVAKAIRKRVPYATIHQPFTPLKRPKYLGWHKSREGDEGHTWLRNKLFELVPTPSTAL